MLFFICKNENLFVYKGSYVSLYLDIKNLYFGIKIHQDDVEIKFCNKNHFNLLKTSTFFLFKDLDFQFGVGSAWNGTGLELKDFKQFQYDLHLNLI